MKQIYRGTLTRHKKQWWFGGVRAINHVGSDGDVVFGYYDRVTPEIKPGMNTVFGTVMNVKNDSVRVLSLGKFESVDKRKMEDILEKYAFVVTDVESRWMGKNEFIFYLQNLNKGYQPFQQFCRPETFIDILTDYLIYKVRYIPKEVFNTKQSDSEHKLTTRKNYDKGRRFKRLVFVRQMVLILTRLHYPEINTFKLAKMCGMSNHAMVNHANNVILGYMCYHRKMSNQIINIVNEIR